MENLIRGPLAKALEAGRPRFNALFAQARRTFPNLDPADFAEHLRTTVTPIVDAVQVVAPERVGEVIDVLFEFSLDLLGRDLMTRHPAVAEGWRRLLPELARHLAAAPRPFAGSVTNALYNLAQTPGARPLEWLESVRELGRRCPDPATLLELGKVVAWRAGLAHFRDGALELCGRLDPTLALVALGLGENGPPLEAILPQLRNDPWLHPAAVDAGAVARLRVMARVGGFRGFGGPFLRPPRVGCSADQFIVTDEESSWVLEADVFGRTLHRTDQPWPAGPPQPTGAFQIEASGRVKRAAWTQTFEDLRNPTSTAANRSTLAVTIPLSHYVYLVALTTLPPAFSR